MDFMGPGATSVKRGGIPLSMLGLLGQVSFSIAITIGVVLCMIAIFSITACSMGIQCMNSNDSYKAGHKGGFGFIVFSLVMSLLLLIFGILIIVARIFAV